MKQDYVQAAKWFKKAAKKGHTRAQYNLGKMYCRGEDEGVTQDYVEALKWFKKAAEKRGFHAKESHLLMDYLDSRMAQDPVQVANWIQNAAHKGSAEVQYRIGEMYYWNPGSWFMDSEPENVETLKWFKKAAEKGHTKAQYQLGEMYYIDGNDVEAEKWYRKAEKGFRKAAEKGDIEAIYQLGERYFWSHPVLERDGVEAEKWSKKAAEKGHADIAHELGERYWREDDAEAEKWFKKAAEKGHADAQYYLGLLYYHDTESVGLRYYQFKGVEQNYTEAIKWFRKSIEYPGSISDTSEYRLGLMYYRWRGRGTKLYRGSKLV